MSRTKKTLMTIGGAFIILVAIIINPCLLRGCDNGRLRVELRVEFDAWLASLPEVPDSENGALVILRGLDLLDGFPDEYYMMLDGDLAEDANLAETMQSYLARNEKALAFIEEGLEFKKWQYPMIYGSDDPDLESLMKISSAADAIKLRGEFAELKSDWDEAWKEHLKVLRLGATLSQDPAMVSRLVETALSCRGLIKLGEILSRNQLSQEMMQGSLLLFLELYDGRGGFLAAMEADYAMFAKMIAEAIEGDKRALKLFRDRSLFFPKCRNWQAEINVYRMFLEMCRNVDPARFYETPREFKDVRLLTEKFGGTSTFTARLLPGMARCVEKLAIADTFWRGVIVLTAVRLFEKRNGRLPENLDELGEFVPEEMLIDPFSGKRLVYKRKGDNFCLYSVGLDGVDNKCEDTRKPFETKADEGEPDDIIFHAPDKKDEDE